MRRDEPPHRQPNRAAQIRGLAKLKQQFTEWVTTHYRFDGVADFPDELLVLEDCLENIPGSTRGTLSRPGAPPLPVPYTYRQAVRKIVAEREAARE